MYFLLNLKILGLWGLRFIQIPWAFFAFIEEISKKILYEK